MALLASWNSLQLVRMMLAMYLDLLNISTFLKI
jgi:hypothetical protein